MPKLSKYGSVELHECTRSTGKMAISALSHDTLSQLDSAVGIASITSLVKELVENALDAGATSIEIQISANTVDRIEVRDNGHGIRQDDLDSVGRRGHTSKIRAFHEIERLGASSLGFRGMALWSVAAIASVAAIQLEPQQILAQVR